MIVYKKISDLRIDLTLMYVFISLSLISMIIGSFWSYGIVLMYISGIGIGSSLLFLGMTVGDVMQLVCNHSWDYTDETHRCCLKCQLKQELTNIASCAYSHR